MSPREEEVEARAHLLPEEEAAGGSADATAQAETILEESEERTNAPAPAPGSESGPRLPGAEEHEHRRSEDTV
jgi:hypothetical protein